MNDVDKLMKSYGIDNGGRDLVDLTDPIRKELDFDGYVLTKVFDDIILVEMIDTDETGLIKKGDLYIANNKTVKSWRKGRVILIGKNVTQCDIGNIVIFPNDNGIQVTNVTVRDNNNLRNIYRGIFIAENKIFGVCEKQ